MVTGNWAGPGRTVRSLAQFTLRREAPLNVVVDRFDPPDEVGEALNQSALVRPGWSVARRPGGRFRVPGRPLCRVAPRCGSGHRPIESGPNPGPGMRGCEPTLALARPVLAQHSPRLRQRR